MFKSIEIFAGLIYNFSPWYEKAITNFNLSNPRAFRIRIQRYLKTISMVVVVDNNGGGLASTIARTYRG